MSVTIDVGLVLRGAVSVPYSNLLTRPTGAAVRQAIEARVSEVADGAGAPMVARIDFSRVELLDFSCADEIVAKLLLRAWQDPAWPGFLTFHGLQDAHLDPIETVLERHALAMVSWHQGEAELFGEVAPEERRHWEAVRDHGPAPLAVLAGVLDVDEGAAATVLARLCDRRLVMTLTGGYAVPGHPGARRDAA